jgi:hypothetical protein
MRAFITKSEFSFIPARKNVAIYFEGEKVDEFEATNAVTKEAQAHIQKVVDAYNKQDGYEVVCRQIREVKEKRRFPLTYPDFNTYVKDWPEAEPFRDWITNSGHNHPKFLQVSGNWNSLPGGYFWVSIREYNVGKDKPLEYAVGINDNDDTACKKDVANKAAAEAELVATLELAPTNMQELCELAGFQWD